MSQQTDMKDKLLLDPTDSEQLMAYFSRLNPGDEIKGNFVGKLDEAGQKTVVVSITEIEIENAGDIRLTMAGKTDGGEDSDEPLAIKMMKDANGVPEQDGNMPPDTLATH